LLFAVGGEGLSAKQLGQVLEMDTATVEDLCDDIAADFVRAGRGIQLIEIAGLYQLTTVPACIPYLEKLVAIPSSQRLSQAALETLAIIAYKQPLTRISLEEIRGVKCDRAINTLLGKQLIKEVGRVEGPGRPFLYGTTREFLDYFGLRNVNDLPSLTTFAALDDTEEA